MITWRSQACEGGRTHIGTYKGKRCAQIWTTRRGTGFQFRNEKRDVHSVRYRRVPSIDHAKATCEELLDQIEGKRWNGVEIINRASRFPETRNDD